MTRAYFYKSGNTLAGFRISGHAMLSTDTPDVLCAAVSGMTNLVINTLIEVFGVTASVDVDESEPSIKLVLASCPDQNTSAVNGIIQGFLLQLEDLQNQYPENLCVTVQQNTTKGTKKS